MGDNERPAGLTAVGLDRQDQAYALIPLRLALRWTMEFGRWTVAGILVERMRSALASGDVDGFRTASADLALAGPLRATGLGDPPTVPIPDPIRERVNELIHILDPRPPDGWHPGDTAQPGELAPRRPE